MSIRDCFNKAATKYDANCQLQLATGEKLLSLIKPAETIIDLGCGTGITTAKLKYKKLYALDISDKLLAQAKLRLGNKNITYLETSFDNFSGLKLDLAFANMSLQWSDNLSLTLRNIKDNLKATGILAFSIPLAGTFSELNISTMPFLSIKQVIEILDGWQIIYSESEEINYLFPNLIEALRSIKSVGANYCKNKTGALPSRDRSPYLLKYNIGYFMVRKI
jgi:malonyl-CoA O-methyltransferase